MFDTLIGNEFDFYGVDWNSFKLDDKIWEAVEDEDDGYRSYLGSIEMRDTQGMIFALMPIARVRLEHWEDCHEDVYVLRDVLDDHIWLRFGTNEMDDYYPYFVFDYKPKAPEGA